MSKYENKVVFEVPQDLAFLRWIGVAILVVIGIILVSASVYVVRPGYRGVEVTLGKPTKEFKTEGLGFKTPFVTTIIPLSIKQRTAKMVGECYSSDLQQVAIDLCVLYRIPEQSVVAVFKDYAGDPFDSLIQPRVTEALKEVTALYSAERIVQQREKVKSEALKIAQLKVGTLLQIEDIVLQHIKLSADLEKAIESKMVRQQESLKAKFAQQQAEIEAETTIIRARGEAEAINVKGLALRENAQFIDLQIVEMWRGRTPLVVGEGMAGANMLLPLDTVNTNAPAR